MNITATINDAGKATLINTHMNTTTRLEVDDAHLLGEDIATTLVHDTVDDIHRDTYSVVLLPNGIEVRTKLGRFDIAWQHIMHTADQLTAF
ncbi:MAG: hypothetical protein F9K34_02660 [Albidovulum sp.]|uniref:hypothetical protein n=1 Tax=Albidovulum sp. TaxID=1872424 RepID=UPI0013256832|nr:hypothetical protein [Defluviimonas sp.]KAB2886275.1 MAG: hypothetical protein F9K34_02660 [Defluviimonas sp.]